MGRKYESVLEMVRDLSSPEFVERFEKQAESKKLGKLLFLLRHKKGLTQKQMAEKLGCAQSRVSKLENAELASIKMGDLLGHMP